MSEEEIAQKIAGLTSEQRDALYWLCEDRKRKNKNGAGVAVYEQVSEEVADALHTQDLVWLIGSTFAAARHDVYHWWQKHIDSLALRPTG